jgi:hypothetical protein
MEVEERDWAVGLPDFFGTRYQNGGKYTKWPQNIPNGHEIFPITVK